MEEDFSESKKEVSEETLASVFTVKTDQALHFVSIINRLSLAFHHLFPAHSASNFLSKQEKNP